MKILQHQLKRLKIIITVFQVIFILSLFLPVAKGPGGAALNSVDLALQYAEIGYWIGSVFYLASAVFAPIITALFLLLSKRQQTGFAVAACLNAYLELVQLCFYSAMQTALSGSARLTGTYPFICLLILFSMFVSIHAYLRAAPPHRHTGKP